MSEDDHDHEHSTEDVWLAILFVCVTGLMIAIGGAMSFVIPRSYSQVLPISLAFSAGVLIYLAFVEVWPATEEGFDSTGEDEWVVHVYTSMTFFGGIVIGAVLDQVVHKLGHEHDHHHMHHSPHVTATKVAQPTTHSSNSLENDDNTLDKQNQSSEHDTDNASAGGNATSNQGMLELVSQNSPLTGDNSNEKENSDHTLKTASRDASRSPQLLPNTSEVVGHGPAITGASSDHEGDNNNKDDIGTKGATAIQQQQQHRLSYVEQKQMMRVSLATAVAVSLHNLPEGLATFVGTIADPAIGFSIAIAVAIHNIPLGVSIATPVYVVTHSKWKAIGIASLAAVTQPIGGLIGLIFVESGISEVSFSLMFGLTGGLMIYTCFRELLPAARYQDPTDVYTSWLVFIGMVVLDVSLIMFDSTGTHEHRR